ncbi:MAG: thioredoxin family protein [Bacteroidota bacterium]
MNPLLQEKWPTAFSYEKYLSMIDRLLADRQTTGSDQSEALIGYTQLNRQRMRRLGKSLRLLPEVGRQLQSLRRRYEWLVITEAWCGDAAQNLPYIHAMAETSERIQLKLVLREEHPELMAAYLTEGTCSVPKLICLDAESREVLGTWGPRPAEIQLMYLRYRAHPYLSLPEFMKKIHLWYSQNQGQSLQQEFLERMAQWEAPKSQGEA